jgi:hypothetical protein
VAEGRYLTDDSLWDVYKDDFKTFNEEAFTKANRRFVAELRASLRCGGVFVAQPDKKTTVAQTMINVINEEEQHEWTPQDIKDLDKDLRKGPITSVVITLEGGQSTSPSAPTTLPTPLHIYAPIAIPNPHVSQGGPRGGGPSGGPITNNAQVSGTAKQISEVPRLSQKSRSSMARMAASSTNTQSSSISASV